MVSTVYVYTSLLVFYFVVDNVVPTSGMRGLSSC